MRLEQLTRDSGWPDFGAGPRVVPNRTDSGPHGTCLSVVQKQEARGTHADTRTPSAADSGPAPADVFIVSENRGIIYLLKNIVIWKLRPRDAAFSSVSLQPRRETGCYGPAEQDLGSFLL